MKYCVTFFSKGKPVANTFVLASSTEEAEIMGEMRMLTWFPNVEFDRTEVNET